MANRRQVLDKISRNLDILGIAQSERGAEGEVNVLDMEISYEDADIQKPEGGVDDSVNPFLGIGIGNPGVIKIKLTSGSLDSIQKLQVLHVCSGHANDIEIVDSSVGGQNGRLRGHADLLGMGA